MGYHLFIHGTALPSPEVFSAIKPPPSSGGDFGWGFYTFKLCDQSHKIAIEGAMQWADKVKAHKPGLDKFMVVVRMRKDLFGTLKQKAHSDDLAKQAYEGLFRQRPSSRTQNDVMIGPVLRNFGTAIRTSLPKQFKFENAGISRHALEIVCVEKIVLEAN